MVTDIQLHITDQELEEFPEEYPPNDTTNGPTDQHDTQCSPTRQFLVLGKETLVQPSVPPTYRKQTRIHLSVPSTLSVTLPKQSLIQPRGPPLLTLQPQPDLPALVRSLTPHAQRYIHIGVHLGCQGSQPGPILLILQ